MIDSSVRQLAEWPTMHEPVLVVMLDGWIDASGAARAAMDAILADADATPIAEFDDDVYIDYRARRPTMELREGHHAAMRWQHITLSAATDSTGRDLLLLSGPEPDTGWHRFCDAVVAVSLQLGVTQMAHLGAYPFAIPHTRQSRLSVSSPSQDVLARVPFLRSSIDVPAGVAAALETSFHDAGVPSLGIWVQVPHYVTSLAYPAASVALLEGLREATGVVVEAAELRAEVISHARKIDALVQGNDDHVRMVGQLEQIFDATDDDVHVEGAGPSLEMRSGDELAAEFEAFLRDQD